MTDHASSTLPRAAKGPRAPPPVLDGALGRVADTIAAWPDVIATTHWTLDQSEVDGIDFYVGDEELGHIHLDGSIHLATSPTLSGQLVAEGLGTPFRWAHGWTLARVGVLGEEGSAALFRRNYDRIVAA